MMLHKINKIQITNHKIILNKKINKMLNNKKNRMKNKDHMINWTKLICHPKRKKVKIKIRIKIKN